MRSEYLINVEHKYFTCEHPKNNFIIDYSNGYPVKITTNVTNKTSWKDIFSGNYQSSVDGTPEYILVDGVKYTYIDKMYAYERGWKFLHVDSDRISKYKPRHERIVSKLINKCLN